MNISYSYIVLGVISLLFDVIVAAGGEQECVVDDDGSCMIQTEEEKSSFSTFFDNEEGESSIHPSQEEKGESIWRLFQWDDENSSNNKNNNADSKPDDSATTTSSTTSKTATSDDGFSLDNWEHIMMTSASVFQYTENQIVSMGLAEKIKLVSTYFGKVKKQMEKAFDGLQLEKFDLLQLFYFAQHEEETKNPSYKKRKHRYFESVNEEQAIALSDAFYFAAMAYTDTCAEIQEYIKNFRDSQFVMLNCTTESTPGKPAHFLAVRHEQEHMEEDSNESQQPEGWRSMFQKKKKKNPGPTELEVVFVVRATKDIMDILTDAMLEAVPYKGGKAHDGLLQAADWLYEEYKDFLPALLKASQRDKLKLWTVGYSLGAGAAALLTLNINDDDNDAIESRSIGFGTPPVVTRELSEAAQSTVRSIINDADCVTRMSGPAVYNAFLRGVEYNYTKYALDDLDQLVPHLREFLPLGESLLTNETVAGIRDSLAKSLRNKFEQEIEQVASVTEFQDVELFPPGECVHFYREPQGWDSRFVPCHLFNELEIVPRMIDDHMLDLGYYVALSNYIRKIKKNYHWGFEYDIFDLKIINEWFQAR